MPINKNELTKEMLAKAMQCETADELIALAKTGGYELTKEEAEAYMAEMERRNIRERQKQGIAVAKAKGVRFGRKPIAYPETWEADYKKWRSGDCTAVSLIRKYKWAPATFYARVREYEHKGSST